MKKFLLIFAIALFWSCSNDEQAQVSKASTKHALSVLDGKLLSYKDDESFIKEYAELAELSTDQLKVWDSAKKFTALLSVSDDSSEIEGDVIPQSRLVYSDALKALLSSESKVKIGGKVLWLNERAFYLLSENEINKSSDELVNEKNSLKVYGRLLSVSNSVKNLTNRNVIPNENKIKTFVSDEGNFNVPGSRIRHVLDLYNETIVFNDEIQSSKMYLRSTLQYRSCSTWRCTWKDASNSRVVDTYSLTGSNSVLWKFSRFQTAVSASSTFLIATWNPNNLPAPVAPSAWFTNFNVSGPFKIYVGNGPWHEVELSWY